MKGFWIKAVVKANIRDKHGYVVEGIFNNRTLDRAINEAIRVMWYAHCWTNGVVDFRKPTMRLRDFRLCVGIHGARPEEFAP